MKELTFIRGSVKEWEHGINIAIHEDNMPKPNSEGWYRIGVGKKKSGDGLYLYVDEYQPKGGK